MSQGNIWVADCITFNMEVGAIKQRQTSLTIVDLGKIEKCPLLCRGGDNNNDYLKSSTGGTVGTFSEDPE